MHLSSNGEVKHRWFPEGTTSINAIVTDSSGAFCALCTSKDALSGDNISIVRYNQDSSVEWRADFREMPSSNGRCLLRTSDSGYLVAGSSGRMGSQQAVLIKFDSSGSTEWSRTYRGAEQSFFSHVIETRNGYVAIGNAMDEMLAGDAWVVETDFTGNQTLNKRIDLRYDSNGSKILESTDGYVALCGTSARDHVDPVIVYLSHEFEILETANLGATSLIEFPCDLQQSTNGNIIAIISRFAVDQERSGILLVEVSDVGGVILQRDLFPDEGHLIPVDAHTNRDNSIVVCGIVTLPGQELLDSESFILRTNPEWNVDLTNN